MLLLAGCGGGSDGSSTSSDSKATSGTSTSSGSTSTTGSATLSWVPPTETTDGAPLTDLAGYYIHYGTSADDLNQTIAVQGGDVSEYEITNLPQGTYYFTVVAYTSSGTESAASDMASKTI
jgi:hypothetical protein